MAAICLPGARSPSSGLTSKRVTCGMTPKINTRSRHTLAAHANHTMSEIIETSTTLDTETKKKTKTLCSENRFIIALAPDHLIIIIPCILYTIG